MRHTSYHSNKRTIGPFAKKRMFHPRHVFLQYIAMVYSSCAMSGAPAKARKEDEGWLPKKWMFALFSIIIIITKIQKKGWMFTFMKLLKVCDDNSQSYYVSWNFKMGWWFSIEKRCNWNGFGQTVRHSIAGHSTIDLPSCQFQVFKVWRRWWHRWKIALWWQRARAFARTMLVPCL